MSWVSTSSLARFLERCRGAFAEKAHSHGAGDISSGTVDPARLPTATSESAGVVKVGSGLSVSDGVLSADGGVGSLSEMSAGDVEEIYCAR